MRLSAVTGCLAPSIPKPKGEIILRIIPTAVHTLEDVNVTIEAFKAVRSKLQDGIYAQLPIPVRADEGFLVR